MVDIVSAKDLHFGKFAASKIIAKVGLRILFQEKTLLLFPLLQGVILLAALPVLAYIFFMSMFFIGLTFSAQSSRFVLTDIFPFITLFFGCLFFYYVFTFVQFGFTHAVNQKMAGSPIAFGQSLFYAFKEQKRIFLWALLIAGVLTALQLLQRIQKFGIGDALSLLGHMTWSAASFFVIPEMVTQKISPTEALKNSVFLFRRTWGEVVITQFSVSAFFSFVELLIISAGAFGAALISFIFGSSFYVVIYVGMCVAAFLFVVILASATATIFKIVLYQYIKNGTFPDNFPEMIIKEAFKSK